MAPSREGSQEELADRVRQRLSAGAGRRPLVLIIAGGSASGKGTLARALAETVKPAATRIVNMDRYFKPIAELPTYFSLRRNGPHPDWNQPNSFRYQELIADIRRWAHDGACAEDLLILEGILALHFEALRELAHLSLFVHTDADERIVRRIRRNMTERGMAFDEVADYYLESVRDRHHQYVEPTRAFADLVIPGGSRPNETEERTSAVAGVAAACLTVLRATPAGEHPPA
jgi:uridine kinase